MLSISIVIYQQKVEIFSELLYSLFKAIEKCNKIYTVESVDIINNSNYEKEIDTLISSYTKKNPLITLITTNKNIGFGRAHNKSLLQAKSKYHLILNPDVVIDKDCLTNGVHFLEKNINVTAVVPRVFDREGNKEYLCKQYPNILDLFLRGFAPKYLKEKYSKRLNRYKEKKITDSDKPSKINIMSGSFILGRTEKLQIIRGFDERYFLYFEDFALSMELSKLGDLYFLPEMKIIHAGGYASQKGIKHLVYFITSGIKFFNYYGWKFK